MKHVAMRMMSTRIKDLPYGCPGFGDIVHSCLLTYGYGLKHQQPATLHIAPHQYNKKKSITWKQVINLFPKDSLFLQVHNFGTLNDEQFLKSLQQIYPDALLHYYEKYPGKIQNVLQPSFFVDNFVNIFPCFKYETNPGIDLPEKFVTAQFDAGSKKRLLTPEQLQKITERWRSKGYEVITVGGGAKDERLKQAPYVGYAMSKSEAHLGVDSGYMHLSQCYYQPNKIFIYTNRPWGKWEHHLKMFKDYGCVINDY